MKKTELKLEFDFDYHVIAISSSQRGYRLCWLLNKALNLEFERVSDYIVSHYEGKTGVGFAHYECHSPIDRVHYHLLHNLNDGKVLLPQLRKFNFLIFISNSEQENFMADILARIKSISYIEAAILPNIDLLNNLENIYFDDLEFE